MAAGSNDSQNFNPISEGHFIYIFSLLKNTRDLDFMAVYGLRPWEGFPTTATANRRPLGSILCKVQQTDTQKLTLKKYSELYKPNKNELISLLGKIQVIFVHKWYNFRILHQLSSLPAEANAK